MSNLHRQVMFTDKSSKSVMFVQYAPRLKTVWKGDYFLIHCKVENNFLMFSSQASNGYTALCCHLEHLTYQLRPNHLEHCSTVHLDRVWLRHSVFSIVPPDPTDESTEIPDTMTSHIPHPSFIPHSSNILH